MKKYPYEFNMPTVIEREFPAPTPRVVPPKGNQYENINDRFISDQICYPIAFVAPEDGVRRATMPPLYSHEGALAEMMQPQNCPVPIAPRMSAQDRRDLGKPARGFFMQIMRPTIKHV